MTGAVMIIEESNGAGEVVTELTGDIMFGNTDAYTLNVNDYPITAGDKSYEKYIKLHFTSLGTMSQVDNLKVWKSGGDALGSYTTLKTNARESSYAGAEAYATPVKTSSTKATQNMPTTTPTGANLGIGGALAGNLAIPGYSDYLVMQVQTTSSEVIGKEITLSFSWDETP